VVYFCCCFCPVKEKRFTRQYPFASVDFRSHTSRSTQIFSLLIKNFFFSFFLSFFLSSCAAAAAASSSCCCGGGGGGGCCFLLSRIILKFVLDPFFLCCI